MAIDFVKCRRKDDHSVTHDIARQSLRLWPDWEPIPEDEGTETPAVQPGQALTPEPPAEPAPDPKSKRRAAATDDKE